MIDINIFTNYMKYGPDYKPKKKYKFDYMEDAVKQWNSEHITKQMLYMIPWDVFIFGDLTDSGYRKDHYGEDILDEREWISQIDVFIDYLYKKYKR